MSLSVKGFLSHAFMGAALFATGAVATAIFFDPLTHALNMPFMHDPFNQNAQALINMVQKNFSSVHEHITGLKGVTGGILNTPFMQEILGPYKEIIQPVTFDNAFTANDM